MAGNKVGQHKAVCKHVGMKFECGVCFRQFTGPNAAKLMKKHVKKHGAK